MFGLLTVNQRAPDNSNQLEMLLGAWTLKENLPDIDPVVLKNPNVKYFFLSPDPKARHSGLDYQNNNITIVKTLGPFYNTGSGDVPIGPTYIIFYSATKK